MATNAGGCCSYCVLHEVLRTKGRVFKAEEPTRVIFVETDSPIVRNALGRACVNLIDCDEEGCLDTSLGTLEASAPANGEDSLRTGFSQWECKELDHASRRLRGRAEDKQIVVWLVGWMYAARMCEKIVMEAADAGVDLTVVVVAQETPAVLDSLSLMRLPLNSGDVERCCLPSACTCRNNPQLTTRVRPARVWDTVANGGATTENASDGFSRYIYHHLYLPLFNLKEYCPRGPRELVWSSSEAKGVLDVVAMPSDWREKVGLIFRGSCPVLGVRLSELFSKYVGETESRLRNIMEVAQRLAPVVLLVENMELFASPSQELFAAREDMDGKLLTTLLLCLDGIHSTAGIAVLALSNGVNPLAMDEALVRPGRFDHWQRVSQFTA